MYSLLEKLGTQITGPIEKAQKEIILNYGAMRLTVDFPANDPKMVIHPSLVHAHIITCLKEEDSSLAACLVGISCSESVSPIKQIADSWIHQVAPVIFSFIHNHAVLGYVLLPEMKF